MFVSSYNTYISTNTSEKINRRDSDVKKNESSSFASKLSQKTTLTPQLTKNFPIDYVANYKVFNNQQKLHDQQISKNEEKFKNINNLKNAKVSYADNSKIFSLIQKPLTPVDNLKKRTLNVPQNILDLKEANLKNIMVNTYIENDKYYQITA